MLSVRFDRAASLYVASPIARCVGRTAKRIPILMYHSITSQTTKRHPYYEINIAPTRFDAQMRFLRENGYSALTLAEAARHLMTGRVPRRSVVITFDDGFRDFYEHGLPILTKYGLTATMFVVSGRTGDCNLLVNDKEYLSWSELRNLQVSSVDIGSHTVTHPQLRTLKAAEIDDEIGRSRQMLEDRLGAPISSFAYPFAFPENDVRFVRELRRTLERHGYEDGVCTVIGTAGPRDDRMFLPRLPINTWDDLGLFRAKLEGGYDWMRPVQRMTKTLKGVLRPE